MLNPYPSKEVPMKKKYVLYPLLIVTILGGIAWWIWDRVIWCKN